MMKVRGRARVRETMSTATKSKRIKFALGIAIPVLVLVTAIVMVSMSLAWFSTTTTASVQSINLATQSAFVLSFGTQGTESDNIPYMGQKAIKSNMLVKPKENILTSDTVEAPYYFVSTLQISTEGKSTDIELALEGVAIYHQQKGEGGDPGTTTALPSNKTIPLAFTWFFKEHDENNATNYNLSNASESEAKKEMKLLFPKAGETWYTPYGAMAFGTSDGLWMPVASLNGVEVSALPENPQPIKNFLAANDQKFDFYIIFAPEKLFWSQFFAQSDNDLSVNEYYGAAEMAEIFGKESHLADDGMYYSDPRYMDATFAFGANLNVVKIEGE